ncbi:MAG: winged helix-turn-helix domain-containing protein [Actinomycetota bacterium]
MRRVLFLTDRSPHEVLPAASTLGADLKTEPLSPEALVRLPDLAPDLVVADGEEDPETCLRVLSALAAAGSPVGVVVVLPRGGLDRFPWHEVADDFVHRDCSEQELRLRLAMIRARRGDTGESVVHLDPVTINVETYQVSVGSRPLDLTYKEFELLRFLAQNPGRVFSRARLLREVWGYDFYGGTRTVDVHVRRLRAKLGPEHEHLIETVRGVGYRAAEAGS